MKKVDSRYIRHSNIIIIVIRMAQPTEVFKFTIVESPINQVNDQSLFRNVSTQPNQSGKHFFTNSNDLRRLQQPKSKSSQIVQQCGMLNKSSNEGFQYTIINENSNKNYPSNNKYIIDSKRFVDSQTLGNNNRRLDIYRKLHFDQKADKKESIILKPAKNENFNRMLQQIGDFKKSISQIRQKLTKNINLSKNQLKYTSQKKKQTPNRYDYSQEGFSYTNYKDLSNRGKSNHSYDRWRSHERNINLFKKTVPIQQFTIDASDPK